MITGYKPGDELLPPEEYEKLREKWMENKRARFINYETPQRDEQVRRVRGQEVKRLKFIPDRDAPTPFELLQENVKVGRNTITKKEPLKQIQQQPVGSKRMLSLNQLDDGEDDSPRDYSDEEDEDNIDNQYEDENEEYYDNQERSTRTINGFLDSEEEIDQQYVSSRSKQLNTIKNSNPPPNRAKSDIGSYSNRNIPTKPSSRYNNTPTNYEELVRPQKDLEHYGISDGSRLRSAMSSSSSTRQGTQSKPTTVSNIRPNSKPMSKPKSSFIEPIHSARSTENLTLNDVKSFPDQEQIPLLEAMLEEKRFSNIQKYAIKKQLAFVKGKLKREEIKLRSKYGDDQ